MKARIGNDSDQRRSALSGRMSRTRSVSEERRARALRADRDGEQRPRQEGHEQQGQVELDARPADSAELVEGPGDEAGRREQRGALPETAAVGRSYIGDEQQQRRGAREPDERGESANHRPCMPVSPGRKPRLRKRLAAPRARSDLGGVLVHRVGRGQSRRAHRRLPAAATARASAHATCARPCRPRVVPPAAMGGSSPLTGFSTLSGMLGGDDPHHPRRVDLLHLRRRRRDHRRRTWILCGRHAISLATFAEDQRGAADAALGRQGRVLRGRVLPAQSAAPVGSVRTSC